MTCRGSRMTPGRAFASKRSGVRSLSAPLRSFVAQGLVDRPNGTSRSPLLDLRATSGKPTPMGSPQPVSTGARVDVGVGRCHEPRHDALTADDHGGVTGAPTGRRRLRPFYGSPSRPAPQTDHERRALGRSRDDRRGAGSQVVEPCLRAAYVIIVEALTPGGLDRRGMMIRSSRKRDVRRRT
jgi:hypothetical protein